MNGLLKVAEQLVVDRLISNDFPLTGSSKARLSFGALSGLFALAGLCFFIFAAYLWLTSNFAPDVAAALAGLLVMIVSGVLALSGYLIKRYKRKRVEELRDDIRESILEALDVLNDEYGAPVRENPKASVCAASAAGYMVGQRLQ